MTAKDELLGPTPRAYRHQPQVEKPIRYPAEREQLHGKPTHIANPPIGALTRWTLRRRSTRLSAKSRGAPRTPNRTPTPPEHPCDAASHRESIPTCGLTGSHNAKSSAKELPENMQQHKTTITHPSSLARPHEHLTFRSTALKKSECTCAEVPGLQASLQSARCGIHPSRSCADASVACSLRDTGWRCARMSLGTVWARGSTVRFTPPFFCTGGRERPSVQLASDRHAMLNKVVGTAASVRRTPAARLQRTTPCVPPKGRHVGATRPGTLSPPIRMASRRAATFVGDQLPLRHRRIGHDRDAQRDSRPFDLCRSESKQ